MQCCLNSVIVLHLNLPSAGSDTLKIAKVISVDLKSAISILRNQSATWATSVRNGDMVGNCDIVNNGDINFVTPLS